MSYLSRYLAVLTFLIAYTSCAQKETDLISDLKHLSSQEMAGRKPGTEGHEKAQAFIIDKLQSCGVEPLYSDYRQIFNIPNSKGPLSGTNIIGKIDGANPKTIVLSAHYDHLGSTKDGVYFGADDNASGVAALLFLAEYFSKNKPAHTLLLVAFDAEEMGLAGAFYFADQFDLDEVVLNINMDMISRSDNKEIYAVGTSHHPEFKPILEAVNRSNPNVKIKFGHDRKNSTLQDWTYNSDHSAFFQKGIPFIYFGVEDHNDYHQFSDTFEKIDQTFYSNVVDMILDFTIEYDSRLDKK